MADWITKKPKKMVDKKTTAKWIEKKPAKMVDKKTTAKWIEKKPSGWITKKQPKTNWITKKEAEEHDTTPARKWITKKKPVRSRSRHQSVAEDKRLSPRDKYERDVLGRDMSDIYIEKKATGGRAGYKGGGAVLKGKKVGIQIK